MEKKILEKLKDKEFVKKIINLGTKGEVKNAFAKEGIEITEKEINDLGEVIVSLISKVSEMPESELEKISGGSKISDALAYLPDMADKLARKVGISEDYSDDVITAAYALQTIFLFESGKLLYKKGKNTWLPNLKGKALSNKKRNNS